MRHLELGLRRVHLECGDQKAVAPGDRFVSIHFRLGSTIPSSPLLNSNSLHSSVFCGASQLTAMLPSLILKNLQASLSARVTIDRSSRRHRDVGRSAFV